jgi:hypothetical protein
MQQEPCVPITLLLAALAHGEALEARIAELSRPKCPADYGVQAAPLTPTEEQTVMALLPPGEVLALDALVASVWPAMDAAGFGADYHHIFRVHLSRLRSRLREGWRIPNANGRGEYVLLAPDRPLPAGYRPLLRTPGAGTPTHVACPECVGEMRAGAARCDPCRRRRDAARKRAIHVACPACGGVKEWRGRTCRPCYLARKRVAA